MKSASSTSGASSSGSALPSLFGKERQLLGWQGLTLQMPGNWNLGKFGGTHDKGELRVDDENGVRLELRWEKTTGTKVEKSVHVEKSARNFLQNIEKDAKKKKQSFTVLEKVHFISKQRRGKEQITNFGWSGEASNPASCGMGVAWYCPVCERVTFAHLVGQEGEAPRKIEKLAGEIFSTLECHGEGGWETWSAWGLGLEVPVEFALARAQYLVSKTELEWVRPKPAGLGGLGRQPERVKISRYPVANVLLEGKELEEWADWNVRAKHKQLALGKPIDDEVNGHEALRFQGPVKDLRMRLLVKIFDFIFRRKTPPAQVLTWVCPESNRLFVFESEVSTANAHVPIDTLDSLACH